MTTNDTDDRQAQSGTNRTGQASDAIRREARQMMDAAKQKAQSMLDEQKGMVAGEISGTAQALHRTADELKQQDHQVMARCADRAAAGLDELSQMVRDRQVGSLLTDMEDFARRQPVLFFGGAIATGFLLARFLKSSSESQTEPGGEYASSSTYAGTQPEAPTGSRSTSAGGVLGEPTLDVPPGTGGL